MTSEYLEKPTRTESDLWRGVAEELAGALRNSHSALVYSLEVMPLTAVLRPKVVVTERAAVESLTRAKRLGLIKD